MSMQEPPRRPFNINQQQGAPADAVRSKIATLMDGVTTREEHRPRPSQPSPAAPLAPTTQPAPPTPGKSLTSLASTPMIDKEVAVSGAAPVIASKEVPMIGQGSEAKFLSSSEAKFSSGNETELLAESSELIGEPIPGAVTIRGRTGGVLIEIGKGSWAELVVVLTDRLTRAANFFRNGKVALELGPRVLTEQELRQLYHLLAQHHLTLGLIRTSAPDTFHLALGLGLAAHLENPDSHLVTTAQPALANVIEEQHFIYSGHLRAGQVLRRSEHILVIGDVNPGATVISDGDILVWGRLRGVAHAGAGGDERAVIVALDLSPVQLRIDEVLAIAPEAQQSKGWGPWRRLTTKQPEIAYLTGNEIVVEAWNATKFGGIATLRR
jgi:septum site-determining protein MinC